MPLVEYWCFLLTWARHNLATQQMTRREFAQFRAHIMDLACE